MKGEDFLWPGVRFARPDTGSGSSGRMSLWIRVCGRFPRVLWGESRAGQGLDPRLAGSEPFPAHLDTVLKARAGRCGPHAVPREQPWVCLGYPLVAA